MVEDCPISHYILANNGVIVSQEHVEIKRLDGSAANFCRLDWHSSEHDSDKLAAA